VTTVLVVDDEPLVRDVMSRYLEHDGHRVVTAEDGETARALIERETPSLVLLDIMLPGRTDGLELCRWIRSTSDLPVILLTARVEETDRIVGLELGADDYVVKPFALEELLARVHAVLRRTNPRLTQIALGDILIDFRRLRVSKGNQEIAMTDREFEVLRHLAERAGSVVSRDELLRLVWGYADAPMTRTVDNFIFRLRHKIEADPHHPKYIRTAHGDGYRFTLHE
jgi:DNA-binding response OmpR family regulator